MVAPKVVILMANYGNDPTEVATPFTVFQQAGFDITFATEQGKIPQCDEKMLKCWTGKLLGAPQAAVKQHAAMFKEPQVNNPVAWSSDTFNLTDYDLVFLPGGHDKGMQQYITSASLHKQLAMYMPMTRRGAMPAKAASAVCHGVQVLAEAPAADGSGKSVIHDFETTSLTNFLENTAFYSTRLLLGDYYKTFGFGTDNVQVAVTKKLDNPKQYKGSMSMSPFVHEDPKYNYLSGRFPVDADLLAKKTVELVRKLRET